MCTFALCHKACLPAKVPLSTDQGAQGRVFFENGPGGMGKTFLYRLLLANVRAQGKVALAVTSSGIVALLMEGGRTAHSNFKIPTLANETSTCR